MTEKQVSLTRDAFLAMAAFAFVLFLHGAVPFFAMPTLGQAVWATGFSQSFINESIFSIYARNFGAPAPAAIAFGLAGAWPAALLIKSGLHPADAYSGMVALWLGLAFFSAYKIGRIFGVQRVLAILGAVLWMSMPIIWAHARYSMLSLGIGLLPFYFLAAWNLFLTNPGSPKASILYVGVYVAAALIAAFMDGYSSMMFAVGSSLLCVYIVIVFPDLRKRLFTVGIPVHVLSFSLAYFLYSSYTAKTEFESQSIDFFRGWGLDLSFAAIPTHGTHWIFDILGLSLKRSNKLYFGDASVWATTFCLPIVLAGLFSWWRIRHDKKIASGLLLLALFGFYMALGPSLKINSIKPDVMQQTRPGRQSALMPPKMAIMPTGNAWISKTLPGFNAMRASYRWSALGIFEFWMLLLLLISTRHAKGNIVVAAALIGLIGLNLPNIVKNWPRYMANREMFFDIDRELVAALEKSLHRNELVAFLPPRNDFMVNYLAPRLGIHTYNIGGDKNLFEAQKKWPAGMLKFNSRFDKNQVQDILLLLLNGDSDVIVMPYFSTLGAAHLWPCVEETRILLTDEEKDDLNNIPDFECPSQQKQKFSSAIHDLKQVPYLEVADSDLFATVRLRPAFSTEDGKLIVKNRIFAGIEYPIAITPNVNNISFVLSDGWHSVEPTHVWSSAASTISLPVPKDCQDKKCSAVLKFGVFGASKQRPVLVKFTAKDRETNWSNTVLATGAEAYEVSVPLQGGAPSRQFSIEVPDATSPMALSGSPDGRTLGISLQRIDLLTPVK